MNLFLHQGMSYIGYNLSIVHTHTMSKYLLLPPPSHDICQRWFHSTLLERICVDQRGPTIAANARFQLRDGLPWPLIACPGLVVTSPTLNYHWSPLFLGIMCADNITEYGLHFRGPRRVDMKLE